ncbi:MAG: hypothetical protein K2X93_03090 [Candidatus Obscuribacterales bacterium]|nr:hypothetical protein [Candidatus Obscuribacterales bacterium]
MNKRQASIRVTALAATLASIAFVSLTGSVEAQVLNPNPSFDGDANMYFPNVESGPTSPPYTAPPEGQPPPIGDGDTPLGINPGHLGYPILPPPSHVPMPLIPPGPEGKAAATAAAAGYLTPPTKFDATDPGIIDSPQDFGPPPVAVTNINPGGGISGDAPIERWGAQSSRDFGRGGGGSTITDFGEKLREKPDLAKMPQSSEDGPRNLNQPQKGQPRRGESLPGAQASTDLNGNRTMFSKQRARLTIAPY